MMGSIFDRRFVIVSGKGGVGKSTVCAALALAAARQGKRVLIVELASKERASKLFEYGKDVGYTPTEVAPGIDVINVTTEPALEEYGLMKLRWKRLYRTVFENPVMRSMLRMMPGMNELLLIGKSWYLEQERDSRSGQYRWDMIIVDAPASGHGALVFQIPHVIMASVKSGPMIEETRRIRDMLVDRERTCINIVTWPEEMPVNEALDMKRLVEDELDIGLGYLFINGVWPTALDEKSGAIMGSAQASEARPGDDSLATVLRTHEFMTRRRQAQDVHLERLSQNCDLPSIQLRYLFQERFGRDAIEKLSHRILVGIDDSSTDQE